MPVGVSTNRTRWVLVALTENTTVPSPGGSSSQPPSRVRSLGLVVTARMRGAGVAAVNWTRTMVAWMIPLLPSELSSEKITQPGAVLVGWRKRIWPRIALGVPAAVDKALAEHLVAAGPVLGDLEVQGALIDVGGAGRRSAGS